MAEIPDVIPTTGTFGPTDTVDVHPITEDIYSKGGHRSVASLTDRDAIYEQRRKEGMTVYVTATTKTYQLSGGTTNGDWVELSLTGSSAGITDHGALTGLDDDDHPQYSLSGHNHDLLYFRETEHINNSSGPTDTGKPVVLNADGKIDVSMIPASGGGTTTINTPVSLGAYVDKVQKLTEQEIHGGIESLNTAESVSAGSPFTVETGIGKLLFVVNAGSDTSGNLFVSGETVDRNTGVTGTGYNTLSIAGVSTDSSTTNPEGEKIHAYTNAYLTSDWFYETVTVYTSGASDVNLSDVDVYHISFEQFNDSPDVTLTTFDMNTYVTNSSAWVYAYLYTVTGSSGIVDVTNVADLSIPDGTAIAGKFYRLRRGALAIPLNGTQDGIFITQQFGPASLSYFEDTTTKVWGTINQEVSALIDHGGLSGLGDDDHPQYSLSGHAHINYTTDAEFATHTGTSNIHFTESSIEFSNISSTGHSHEYSSIFNTGHTHSEFSDWNYLDGNLSTHTGTSNIHFTEGSIDHGSISGLGDNDHPQYMLSGASTGIQQGEVISAQTLYVTGVSTYSEFLNLEVINLHATNSIDVDNDIDLAAGSTIKWGTNALSHSSGNLSWTSGYLSVSESVRCGTGTGDGYRWGFTSASILNPAGTNLICNGAWSATSLFATTGSIYSGGVDIATLWGGTDYSYLDTGLDSHTGTGNIHFTEASIDIDNIISAHTHDYVAGNQKGLVYVTSTDTIARYLFSSLSEGNGIDLAVTNPSGDEGIQVSVVESELDFSAIPSTGHSHLASEIGAGTFGAGTFTFEDDVRFNDNIYVNYNDIATASVIYMHDGTSVDGASLSFDQTAQQLNISHNTNFGGNYLSTDGDSTGYDLYLNTGAENTTRIWFGNAIGDFDTHSLSYVTGNTWFEFSHDLNVDGQILSGGTDIATLNKQTFKKIVYVEPPTGADDFPVLSVPFDCTITRITHQVDSGGIVWNMEERAESTPFTTGTNIYTSPESTSTTQSVDTSFANAGLSANTILHYKATTKIGTPTKMMITITYTED